MMKMNLWQTHAQHSATNIHDAHVVEMETINAGAMKSNNESLKLLLMDREVSGLDIKYAVAREAEHVLCGVV